MGFLASAHSSRSSAFPLYVKGLGLEFRVQGSGFRVQGSGFRNPLQKAPNARNPNPTWGFPILEIPCLKGILLYLGVARGTPIIGSPPIYDLSGL